MILESRRNQGYQIYFSLKTIKKSSLIATDSPLLEKNTADIISCGPPFGPPVNSQRLLH